MEREIYGNILRVNLKHNFVAPFMIAAVVFALATQLFNMTALGGREIARPFEFFLSWVGVILLTPIFLPEQDEAVKEVVCARKISYTRVCLVRLSYSITAVVVLEILFGAVMSACESSVTVWHVMGGIATALFLGAIGFFVSGISGNTVLGYMAAVIIYLLNYGLKEKLKMFFIFSMSADGSFSEKWWLFAGAVVLLAAGLNPLHRKITLRE